MATLADKLISKQSSGGSAPVGLSDALLTLSGESAVWEQHNIDVSAYNGSTGRIIVKYASGSSYTGDIQFDSVSVGSNTFNFDASNDSWEQSGIVNTTVYESVSWGAIGTGTTIGMFNRDSGGTPSTGTGLTSAASGFYYIYAETSSSGMNAIFWARSPPISINGDTLTIYVARSGATIGTLTVHLDIE